MVLFSSLIVFLLVAWVLLAFGTGLVVAVIGLRQNRARQETWAPSHPERRTVTRDRRIGLPDPRSNPVDRRSGRDRRDGALPA